MREPDLVLRNDDGGVYLKRWWLIPRNRFVNLYLHQFLGSDDDRALHDHPWWFVSWIVKGQYFEHTPNLNKWQSVKYLVRLRRRWSIAYRPAKWAHRIELETERIGQWEWREKPVWTVILTGPVIRKWGFHCPKGWIYHSDFGKQGGCE